MNTTAAAVAARTESPFARSLGLHLGECERARGRGFAMQCVGERLHGWVAPRFFTTVVFAASLIAALAVWA